MSEITQVCQVSDAGHTSVAILDGTSLRVLNSGSMLNCAIVAIHQRKSLAEYLRGLSVVQTIAIDQAQFELPVSTRNPQLIFVGGTGLTHVGKDRDQMHGGGDESSLTDSAKMQLRGAETGKSQNPRTCWEPEFFGKGDGRTLVKPGGELIIPSWGLDGGEEAELVGVFYIDKSGNVHKIGYCIGNEFSDHRAEKRNYLHLAGSKLRTCSVGPALLLSEAPPKITGHVSLFHNGEAGAYWSSEFSTGESVMHYTIANLDWHHFKHAHNRLPNSIHYVYYGTAMLSFTAGIEIQSGDTIRIDAPDFGLPLINTVRRLTQVEDSFEISNLF